MRVIRMDELLDLVDKNDKVIGQKLRYVLNLI